MNLRPLNDRVIVKRLDQETKTASGLIIPDAAAESQIKAKSWLLAMARSWTTAKYVLWMSK
jgi:co-chaperonin GroES (HSP10)